MVEVLECQVENHEVYPGRGGWEALAHVQWQHEEIGLRAQHQWEGAQAILGSRWGQQDLTGMATAGKERRIYSWTGFSTPWGQASEVTMGQWEAFYCADSDQNETHLSGLVRG